MCKLSSIKSLKSHSLGISLVSALCFASSFFLLLTSAIHWRHVPSVICEAFFGITTYQQLWSFSAIFTYGAFKIFKVSNLSNPLKIYKNINWDVRICFGDHQHLRLQSIHLISLSRTNILTNSCNCESLLSMPYLSRILGSLCFSHQRSHLQHRAIRSE